VVQANIAYLAQETTYRRWSNRSFFGRRRPFLSDFFVFLLQDFLFAPDREGSINRGGLQQKFSLRSKQQHRHVDTVSNSIGRGT
jgi:hypothetical protein